MKGRSSSLCAYLTQSLSRDLYSLIRLIIVFGSISEKFLLGDNARNSFRSRASWWKESSNLLVLCTEHNGLQSASVDIVTWVQRGDRWLGDLRNMLYLVVGCRTAHALECRSTEALMYLTTASMYIGIRCSNSLAIGLTRLAR